MPIKNPKPMHPGQVLAEVYMKEMGLNQSTLAAKVGCAHRKINEIVNGKRGISADFAIDLERTLGTSAEMWINMQASYDLWVARQKRKKAA
jgi:addiction module HigA family antidote